jgi:hypothetical protein
VTGIREEKVFLEGEDCRLGWASLVHTFSDLCFHPKGIKRKATAE